MDVVKALWSVAIVSSVLLVLQLIFSIVSGADHHDIGPDTGGLDHHDGGVSVDSDHGTDFEGFFRPFTVKNLIAFFAGFSWGTLAFLGFGFGLGSSLFVGIFIGLALVVFTGFLMFQLCKLTHSGTLTLQSYVNSNGHVYLTIPGYEEQGHGTVIVNVFGSSREHDAITTSFKKLEAGEPVRVVGTQGNLLIVEPLT